VPTGKLRLGLTLALALSTWLSPPAARGAPEPFGLTPSLYAVVINGDEVSSGSLVYERGGDVVLIAVTDLRSWHLRVPTKVVVIHGHPFASLKDLAGLSYSIDRSTLRLNITAAVSAFMPSELRVEGREASGHNTPGLRLDYDLVASVPNRGASTFSGVQSVGFFGVRSNLGTTLLEQPGSEGTHIVRLETTWSHDNPQTLQTVTLGDATSIGDTLLPAVRFGGIGIGTDFGLNPYLRFGPVVTVGGSALVPSTVEAFVNDALAYQARVLPGPFSLNDLPVVDDAGTIKLVITDALGRQQVLEEPYLTDASLLRPGLSQSYAALGALREDFGLRSNLYGPVMGMAAQRRGLGERWTQEVDVTYAPGDTAAGIAESYLVSGLGLLSAGLVASAGRLGGAEGVFQFSRSRGRLRLGVHDAFASRGFRLLDQPVTATPPPAPTAIANLGQSPMLFTVSEPRQSLQADVALDGAGGGTMSAAYAGQVTFAGAVTRILSAAYTHRLREGQLSLQFLHVTGSNTTSLVALGYVLPLGRGRSVDVQTTAGGGASTATLTVDQAQPVSGTGFGYHLTGGSLGGEPYADGRFIAATGVQTISLEDTQAGTENVGRLEVAGSAGIVGDAWYASPPLGSAFGIVRTGLPGIPVTVNGQAMGSTDGHGTLVLRTLQPFENNSVSLDVGVLPLDVAAEHDGQTVAPARNGAVLIDLPVRPLQSALVRILDAAGKPLPAGSAVYRESGGGGWPVADDGETYLPELHPGDNFFEAITPSGRCRVRLRLQGQTRGIVRLPAVTCAPLMPAAQAPPQSR
jgi:outer membrane usher protein